MVGDPVADDRGGAVSERVRHRFELSERPPGEHENLGDVDVGDGGEIGGLRLGELLGKRFDGAALVGE